MSRPHSLFRQMADARAQMMLMGHRSLKLEIGRQTREDLGAARMTVMSWPEIHTLELLDDAEGFLFRVRADTCQKPD